MTQPEHSQALFWDENPTDYAVEVGGPWRLYTHQGLQQGRIWGVVTHRSGQTGALVLLPDGTLSQVNWGVAHTLPNQDTLKDLCRNSARAQLNAMHTPKMRQKPRYIEVMVAVVVDRMRFSEASRLCAHPSITHVRIYQAYTKFLEQHGLPPHT